MISMIEKHRRAIVVLGLALLLLIAGVTLLEHDIEMSGVGFAIFGIVMLIYLPSFWWLTRKGEAQRIQRYLQREYLLIALIVGILSLLAAIESSSHYLVFSIIFGEILLILMAWIYTKRRGMKSAAGEIEKSTNRRSKTWIYLTLIIGNGILILLLEDIFKDKEAFGIALLCYFLMIVILFFNWLFHQITTVIHLRNEQKRTELLHLQSQVNPHFFFNMLNNLYGWTGKDPKKAQELILKLSDLMRYSIYEGQKKTVSLEQEVTYLKNYMELHQSRYHQPIDISFTTDIQVPEVQVLPLLFIILLENAFKHGVEKLGATAYVKVSLVAKEAEIRFSLENNFDTTEEQQQSGIGLTNLAKRLALVYPNRHSLSLTTNQDIYKAELIIEN